MRRFMSTCALMLFVIGCGGGSAGSDNSGGGGSDNAMSESCFVDEECLDSQYCRASDPVSSPEGECAALESGGGDCIFATQCAGGLACVKMVRSGSGVCEALPESCEEDPTCMCALSLCESLEGSSCSVGDLDAPGSSITVSCAADQ
jgi:hypothetical protein